MHDDTKFEAERQQLFTLVWERPASEVARVLGISDVALGKRCKRLQVPKPPRGYWAKVASGVIPKRPALPAYREALRKRLLRQARPERQVRMSDLQVQFLGRALGELASVGIDTSRCDIARDGIRSIPPELAVQVLIVIEDRYEKWLSDRKSPASLNAGMSSLRNLVKKLLPSAQEQLIVFHQRSDNAYTRGDCGPAISLRSTQDFMERVAQLSRVASDNALTYVVADLSGLEYSWSLNRIYSPSAYKADELQLCVSSREVWIQGKAAQPWYRERYETIRIALRDIGPLDLIPLSERKLPPAIRRSMIAPYADRLQTILEARSIYHTLIHATFDIERTIPDERLAQFDRLWFVSGEYGTGPLLEARRAWQRMEDELDRWEQMLDAESAELCRDVLGIEIGDIVIVEAGKNLVRIRVEGMDVYSSEGRVIFSVWGLRYRKDGLPGKRTEQFSISLENDTQASN